jgi:hypothetical protein
VRRRLSRRGIGWGLHRDQWALARIDEGLARLREPEFAEQLDTGHRTVAQVAELIAHRAGLPIAPSTDGRLRAALRRRTTSLRHLRPR